jgi:two-component system sensor histidine kinase YcbA
MVRGESTYQNIFMISMISVLMGQFYISPPGTDFRMTLAVFFMSLFLVYFEHYNAMLITLSVGLSTFLFRSVVYALGNGVPFFEAASIYAPVLSYYVLFGALFIALAVRRYFHQPFHFFIALWVCDTIPNLFEAFLRRTWVVVPFDRLVMTIAAVGAMRTIMVLFSFYLGRYYIGKSKRDEREKNYRELVLFISRLKTELFLLKKSRQDIEATMALAHDVYETAGDERLRGPLLKIAKDIHEIKKDYLRVIAGMDAIFSRDTEKKHMSIEEILTIVTDNVERLAGQREMKIQVSSSYDQFFTTEDFFPLISILNNLTVNSLEAMENYGYLEIVSQVVHDQVHLVVRDSGSGIAPGKEALIFDAGYTTKYDPITGKMSTGLGLSHVKHLVESYYGGRLTIESSPGMGTTVAVAVSRERLTGGGEANGVRTDHR